MPTDEAADLIELTREICRKELAPKVDDAERKRDFPAETFRTLGQAGLLSLPYPEEFGGADQPYEVYLQVVEEIGSVWMSVAVGVSVHSLTAYPVAAFGSRQQQEALLPGMLSGEQLGAYCLSEPLAGSDIASMITRATRTTGPGSRTQATPTTTRPSPAPPTPEPRGSRPSSCPATRRACSSPNPNARWACTATPSRR